MEKAVVCAPGKVNFTLDILAKRPDGYHEMEMLMHAVSLENTVHLEKRNRPGIVVSCTNPLVPANENNLAYKAASAFFGSCGQETGLTIHIEKRVPMEAGMGGGSADAAAVLVGLNHLMNTRLPLEDLCRIGLPLGADIPFCLTGGAALVTGIGEKIAPLPPLEKGWLLIAKPPQSMKTKNCFAAFDALTKVRHPDTPKALRALADQDLAALGQSLQNVLEQAVPFPAVQDIRQRMLQNGALGSRMTGSGTAVFGLFRDKKQALHCARRLYLVGGSFFIARPVSYGAHLLAED